ncbi:hypothetical protein Sango_3083000 [Sesamum angolense]|uniref:Uncharacterized protein n=1 Tax=Sesamum angolense TaxID=2727404 RepID=A0AAE1W145_9LAMI|nr:hypothetical protein Sango_3083000 [Sesamum angolense]
MQKLMYPFERFLRELKKKVKNKAHVEASIVEEIDLFTSQYFDRTCNPNEACLKQMMSAQAAMMDSRSYLNELYQHHHPTDLIIDRLVSTEFKDWFKRHTERHNTGKSTMHCGVCVKSSSHTDEENDFYGIIEKIIQLTCPLIPNLHIVLFKFRWVDPVRGMKVHPRHHLVDVNFKKLYQKDDPFILA